MTLSPPSTTFYPADPEMDSLDPLSPSGGPIDSHQDPLSGIPSNTYSLSDSQAEKGDFKSVSLNIACVYGVAIVASYIIFFWALATEVKCDNPLVIWMGIHNFIIIPGITLAYIQFRKFDRKLEQSYRQSQSKTQEENEVDDPLGGAPVAVVAVPLKTHKYYKRRTFSLIFLCLFILFWFIWEIIGCSFIIEEQQCNDSTTFIFNTVLAFGGLTILTILLLYSLYLQLSHKNSTSLNPFEFGWNRFEHNSNSFISRSQHENLLDNQYSDSRPSENENDTPTIENDEHNTIHDSYIITPP